MTARIRNLLPILFVFAAACLPQTEPRQTAQPVVTPALTRSEGIWQPAPGMTWQWQLSGEIDTSFDVDMYDIDLFDVPAGTLADLHRDGRTVICYFSAGTFEDWRPDAARFPEEVLGSELDGWPGERWLDIRQLELLSSIMLARLDLAAAKGCDGVEPDNVDGYANGTGFDLSGSDQLVFNRRLADEAHARGLSIGLKNDLDQLEALVGEFDWALNEACFAYDECERLLVFVRAGKAVFGVEYSGDPDDFCPQANAYGFDWLLKTPDLDAGSTACREF